MRASIIKVGVYPPSDVNVTPSNHLVSCGSVRYKSEVPVYTFCSLAPAAAALPDTAAAPACEKRRSCLVTAAGGCDNSLLLICCRGFICIYIELLDLKKKRARRRCVWLQSLWHGSTRTRMGGSE